jgi:Protein of unknown function (DUF2934)
MTEREQRVREIAHRLWEEEGRPPDQEKRHWATAERMFEAEKTVGTGSDATPPREKAQTASASGTGKRRTASKNAKRTLVGSETSATRPH